MSRQSIPTCFYYKNKSENAYKGNERVIFKFGYKEGVLLKVDSVLYFHSLTLSSVKFNNRYTCLFVKYFLIVKRILLQALKLINVRAEMSSRVHLIYQFPIPLTLRIFQMSKIRFQEVKYLSKAAYLLQKRVKIQILYSSKLEIESQLHIHCLGLEDVNSCAAQFVHQYTNKINPYSILQFC